MGENVLDRISSPPARFWYTTQPRDWTDPENGLTYAVDSNGDIVVPKPFWGAVSLEYTAGGGMSFLKYSPTKLKSLVSTEAGAQSAEKVASIAAKMKANDSYLLLDLFLHISIREKLIS